MATQAVGPTDRTDYRVHRETSRYLVKNAASLAGVLILPARPDISSPADQRIMDIYYYHKKETLPVYLMSFGTVVLPVLSPSRGNITHLPREGPAAGITLESGRYAVLSRIPAVDCANLPRWLKGRKVVAHASSTKMPGLTVCDLTFEP
jgi:hypothetical protein